MSVRHFALDQAIRFLVLEKQHRIRIVDRGVEQTFDVGRERRRHDLQTGHVIEQRFDRNRMRERAADATAVRCADHQRTGVLAVGAIASLGRLADDLIERRIDEIGKLNFGDRTQAFHRHPDSDADDRGFGNRRIDHPIRTKLVDEILADQKDVSARADVFTQDERAVVIFHRVVERRPDGLDVIHHSHGCQAPS